MLKSMGRQKQNQESIRKLTKVGQKSYAITIPIEIVREMGLRERQKLVVKLKKNKIVITDFQ